MKKTMWGAAVLAAMAAHSVYAGDATVLEPGLRFAWHFGAAPTESAPSLSLGLYPNDLGWRRLWADAGVEEAAKLERPAVLDLRIGSNTGLHLMGLPLNAQALGLNADGEASGGSFLKPVLIVLAAGAATALVISSAGDAAEDNNPSVNATGGGGDGGGGVTGVGDDGAGCVNGECAVPCETTNTCSNGG